MKEKQRRTRILITVLILTFMVTLDSSIVNVALPVMAQKLHVTMASIEWTVTSYLVVMTAFVLLFGKLGDTFGKVKIFQIGGLVFTIGSALCSVSSSLFMLIIARLIQGSGAAAALACNQGIITEVYPDEQRGKALGMISTAVALGLMVGPMAGGLIMSVAKWQYIFVINVPVGIAAYIAGRKYLPADVLQKQPPLDVIGILTSSAAILCIVIALTLLQTRTTWFEYTMLAAGVVCFVSFLVIQKHKKQPLLPLSMFHNRLFSINLFCMFVCFAVIGATNILLPFYLQDAMRYSAGFSGLLLTVTPLVMALLGPWSGSLSDRIGGHRVLCSGMLLFGLGSLLCIWWLDLDSSAIMIGLLLALSAAGNAMVQPASNSLLMSSADASNYGFAGSIGALIRNLGITMGITLSTSLLYNRMSAIVHFAVHGFLKNQPQVFITGLHWDYAAMAVFLFIGALLMYYEYRRFVLKQEGNQ